MENYEGFWKIDERSKRRNHIVVTIVTEGPPCIGGEVVTTDTKREVGIRRSISTITTSTLNPPYNGHGGCTSTESTPADKSCPSKKESKTQAWKNRRKEKRALKREKKEKGEFKQKSEAKFKAPVQRITSVWAIPEDEQGCAHILDHKQREARQSMVAFASTTKYEDESSSAILATKDLQHVFVNMFSYLYLPQVGEECESEKSKFVRNGAMD